MVNSGLFVYGTLVFDGVLDALLDYVPKKEPLVMKGYVAKIIHLEGWEPFPVLLESIDHSVSGFVLKDLTEQDLERLDRYEYVDEGYYTRQLIYISSDVYVTVYEPAKNIFEVGKLGDVWSVETIDPLLESIYVDSVVPKFRREHPDIFM